MDIFSELEAMAGAASHFTLPEDISTDAISTDAISRWQRLFHFSEATAREQIQYFRADLSCRPISDDLWASIASRYEALGFDKEAYEYSLSYSRPSAPTSIPHPAPEEGSFLLKIDHLLTLDRLQSILDLTEPLSAMTGHSTDDYSLSSSVPATFVDIDGAQKARLLAYLAAHEPHYRPTIIKRTHPAPKDLSDVFDTPRLGFDVTLPQYRPEHNDEPQPRPRQDEYPVWYFFYGTLGEPERLGRLLGLEGEPALKEAALRDGVGRLGTWGGRYKALVNGQGKGKEVVGKGFLVGSKEHEDLLREYETDQYEVARCEFVIADGVEMKAQRGLTFRFRGLLD